MGKTYKDTPNIHRKDGAPQRLKCHSHRCFMCNWEKFRNRIEKTKEKRKALRLEEIDSQ